MNTQRILAAIGRGLIAGLAGTAAITISSTIEMKLRKRPASTTPGKVGGKVLGVKPRNQEGMKRFSNAIVVVGLPLIPAPHAEPAKWAG